jgi:hypothetical protein
VIVVRRDLAGIHQSSERALKRALDHLTYGRALTGDNRWIRFAIRIHKNRAGFWLFSAIGRWNLRVRVLGMLRAASRLPLDRVAFLSYDEMVADPELGAHWAAHILDSDKLGKEFRRSHSLPLSPKKGSSRIDRLLDRHWTKLWERSRAAQVRAEILPPDTGYIGSTS